jgi:hypothetical protein
MSITTRLPRLEISSRHQFSEISARAEEGSLHCKLSQAEIDKRCQGALKIK